MSVSVKAKTMSRLTNLFVRYTAPGLLSASVLGCAALSNLGVTPQASEDGADSPSAAPETASVNPQPDNIELPEPDTELPAALSRAFEDAARQHMEGSDKFGQSEHYPVEVLKVRAFSDWDDTYDNGEQVWAYGVKVAFLRQRNGTHVYPHCWLAHVTMFAKEKKEASSLSASDLYNAREGSGQRIDCGDGSWKH